MLSLVRIVVTTCVTRCSRIGLANADLHHVPLSGSRCAAKIFKGMLLELAVAVSFKVIIGGYRK